MPTTPTAHHQDTPWHALPASDIATHLATDVHHGLPHAEAAQRLIQHGPNQLPAPPRRPAWRRLLAQFNNVLIYVMLVSAVITAALGHWIDTGVLLGAVIVNAILGFVQEGKAESALDAIRRMLSPQTTVLRGGERQQIAAEQLVPGDIVLLASGDKVPADLRILSAKSLRADEAVLTGESVPSDKNEDPVAEDAPLGDRRGMLYSGTLVAAGTAVGAVAATGTRTELGRISALLAQVETGTTPLLRQIAHFSHWLAGAILVFVLATFAIGVLWRGQAPGDMFLMAVALAASAIPEGLPAIMTVTLALGVRRMARHRAIIRHLPAVETLGSVTVICSDKTGTLTCNEMTVQRAVTAGRVYEVTGSGYAPQGGFQVGGMDASPAGDPVLQGMARAALLCNDSALHQGAEGWTLTGDPTEGALLTFALKAGLDGPATHEALPRIDAIPFESEHRFMATLHHDRASEDGQALILLKGAPERVLDMCDSQATTRLGAQEPAALDHDYWRRAANDCAARALRVLAVAVKRVPARQSTLSWQDMEGGFTLLGILGSMDPPRPEAMAAVAECHSAGVRVKMITGDHGETARAIGAQLGIGLGRPALTGAEIELMDDDALREVVDNVDVFARASPEHKIRLVQALQARGEVVAMTGDGVNDAPALKRADVGVAMGRNGTEAAKDAAAMVLADDNFATLGAAVREGRGVYDNVRKFILFMLPTNGGEALVVFFAIAFALQLPLTAAQVLWINLATSGTLGLALAFEPTESDVMQRPPRDPRDSLLSGLFVWRIFMVSLLMAGAALGLFLWELERGASLETARTVAVSTVVAAEMFYLLSSRHVLRSALTREGLLGNPQVLLAMAACAMLQLAFVHAPWLQAVFGSTDLAPDEWLRVLLAGALVFVVAELEKWVLRRWDRVRPAARTAP
ncbi:cation-transporting P-type ATPase [Oryzisolibacter sp. LB2S]|uniref:cation-transporting P-type ATPase n=1 Tax=Alicycliphilus soli TaxID=3228789 RepID=UPI003459E503